MLERTEENAKMLRDKYYDLSYQAALQAQKETIASTNEMYAILQELHPEERYPVLEQLESLIPEDEEYLKGEYDLKNCSKHEKAPLCVKNILPYIEDMSTLEQETFRVLTYDEHMKMIWAGTSCGQKENAISTIPVIDILYEALSKPEARYIATVHNHPHVVAVRPSNQDGRTAARIKVLLDMVHIYYYDDCIIGPMDFYSRKTEEYRKGEHGKDKILVNPILSEETLQTIRKENLFAVSLFKTSYGLRREDEKKDGE